MTQTRTISRSDLTRAAQQFRVRLTDEEYHDMVDANGGYCTACGDEAYGIEPDARNYPCESCGADKVYGIEEMLMMGWVEITGDDDGDGDEYWAITESL